MPKVRLLPQYIIKQIAAGEVIERPASVVKELLENSIDASATSIELSIRNGGKSFISVLDDGLGIDKEDLRATLFKHTTSKLNTNDLYDIRTMGFRGEALYSIAYMSKLTIASRKEGSKEAYQVYAENDYISNIKPSNLRKQGTYIEVRDLFFSLPARLKFLRSDIIEANNIYKIVDLLAMAHPHIGFKVFNNGKKIVEYTRSTKHLTCTNFYDTMKESLNMRLRDVINKNFADNSLFIYTPSTDYVIYGYCSIPTYTVHNSTKQYFFVNKRIIKDRSFFGIIKAAYSGVIENNRYPIVALFIDIDPESIDINVSPSKTEIRFRDTEQIKKFIIESIKSTIRKPNLQRTSSLLPQTLIHTMNKLGKKKVPIDFKNKPKTFNDIKYVNYDSQYTEKQVLCESKDVLDLKFVKKSTNFDKLLNEMNSYETNNKQYKIKHDTLNTNDISYSYEKDKNDTNNITSIDCSTVEKDLESTTNNNDLFPKFKLGFAKAQYNENWIISESENGLIILDQHAAHERITQEKLYKQFIDEKVTTNTLLLPEVVDIEPKNLDLLLSFKDSLYKLGLVIDKFTDHAIIIREYPKILGAKIAFKELIDSIILDLKDLESHEFFLMKLRSVISKMACHSSIRSGDKLSVSEMNYLLRQVENTENSAECPHGRPTYIILSWNDIEKLFNRR